MSAFAERGGVGLFGRPHTDMKCAGAPLKYAFITDDRLRRAGSRGKAELHYLAPQKVLFSVPIVSEKVRMLFQDRGIRTHYEHQLVSLDLGRRLATYRSPAGTTELQYDFIHVVPPMRAPEVVRNSLATVVGFEWVWRRDGRIVSRRLVQSELLGLLGGGVALVIMAAVSSSGFTDAGPGRQNGF